MKKTVILLLIGTLILSGCGKNGVENRNISTTASVESVLKEKTGQTEEPTATPTAMPTAETTGGASEPGKGPEGNFDVDLTVMSATMVYSEVFNMLSDPTQYVGKSVKIKGTFDAFTSDETGYTYYYCVIKDATACCAQGMEFVPNGLKYPDDFPERGTEVFVTGVFGVYLENDMMYCALRNAELVRA